MAASRRPTSTPEQGSGVSVQRATALLEAAQALLGVDDAKATELAKQAAETAGQLTQQRTEALALLVRGRAEQATGRTEAATLSYASALQKFEQLQDRAGEVEVLEAQSRLYLYQGEPLFAEECLNKALTLAVGPDTSTVRAKLLNLLAGVYHKAGDYQKSINALKQALEIYQVSEDLKGEASLRCNLGVLYMSLGRYQEALEDLSLAYTLFSTLQDDANFNILLINLGYLHLDIGRPEQAAHYFEEALAFAQAKGDLFQESTATLNLGVTAVARGEDAAAESSFRSALRLAQELGYREVEVSALDGLGGVLSRSGRWAEAAAAHGEAARLAGEAEDLEGELDALVHLGRARLALDDLEGARTSLERACALADGAHHQKAMSEAHLALSDVLEALGQPARALQHYKAHHHAERALTSEQTARQTQELSVKFEVERTRHEAAVQRLQREAAEAAQLHAEQQVRERTSELERTQLEVVTRLAVAAEYRDDLTGAHTVRVGHFSALIARELGLPAEDVSLIRQAARLHDVGKIGIPDALLLKPGQFTPEEFERMKSHTLIGARILSGGQSRLLRLAEEIALSHHERWDGSGYPLGRAGEAIPLLGRIVAVADVFDALTQRRPYKPAWSVDDALQEIGAQAGRQFDPLVVAASLKVLDAPEVRAAVARGS